MSTVAKNHSGLNNKYRSVFEANGIATAVVNAEHLIVLANQAFADLVGYDKTDMENHKSWLEFIDKENLPPMPDGRKPHQFFSSHASQTYAASLIHRTGQKKSVQITAAAMPGEDLCIVSVVEMAIQHQSGELLVDAQKKTQALIDAIPDTLFRLSRDGVIQNCIMHFSHHYSSIINTMVGKKVTEVMPRSSARRMMRCIEKVLKTKELATLEYQYPGESGPLFFEARLVASGENEVLAIVRDITERKQMEQQLQYMSFHDALTGLYNRAYFEQEMNRLKSARPDEVGVVICDVDGLKLINDSLGHHMGDKVLKEVARMIKSAFRASDMVARIGGDEFAVLLPTQSTQLCVNACKRINRMVANYNKGSEMMPIGISIGYAMGKDSTVSLEEVLKEADNWMYRQKLHHHKSSRSAIVDALMKALQTRDHITEGHGERLEKLTVLLAEAVGIAENNIHDLRLFARFHDIGKVGIPDRILFKPARLTTKEFTVMKQHSEIGCRIAASIPDLAPIADWILMHHEWWNGKGYPIGSENTAIPIECRILAIADAYDAMTNDRPYRKAMSRKRAVNELQRCAGTQFDPELVRIFVENI